MFDWFNRLPTATETKAVTSWSGTTTSLTTSIPDRVKLIQDPVLLMNYNRGYVYAAVSKLSTVLGSLPFRLYAYVYEGKASSLITKHAKLTQNTAMIQGKAMGMRQGARKTLIEIYEHPFLDLMRAPFPGWSQTEFFRVISGYLSILGNAYIRIHRKGRDIVGLEPLQAEYVAIKYDRQGVITKYIYNAHGTIGKVEMAPEEVLHIRNRVPGSLIAGMGDLEAALASANLSNAALAYLSSLLGNMAVPGTIVAIKDFNGSPDQAQKFTDKFIERFGKTNRGKPMVTFGNAEIKRADATMQETRTDYFTDQARKEIAACFGIPLDLLDSANSNRATAVTAMQQMKQFTVYPRAGLILDQLNTEIVRKLYDPQLMYWYDATEATDSDPKEQADTLKIQLDAGIITVNEARQSLGMPMLDGDQYNTPKGMQ